MHAAQGGAERVLSGLTAHLAALGHEVLLMSFDSPGATSFYRIDPRIRRICLGIGNTLKKARLRETITRVRAMRRVVVREKPDVVIGFMHSVYVPLALGMLGTARPLIASEHIVPEHYRQRRMEFALLLASAPFVTRFTAVSEQARALYPRIVRSRMISIPNPVEAIATEVSVGNKPNRGGVILNVGRLEPQKDHATLVEAFARIAPMFPDWQLRIVGEGALRGDLQQQIVALGMSDRIKLLGATPDVNKSYSEADIFAVSSRYESFGLATAEAMAHGLPVVGFRECPGTNELVNHEVNGLLVNSTDRVANLATALKRLMTDASLRSSLGERARQGLSAYAPSRVMPIWETLLEETVRKISNGRN